MERKYWTLVVLDEAGRGGLSPIQLQKSLFLIGKNLAQEVGDSYYDFIPYNYGPFDSDVYSDAQSLIVDGLVQTIQVSGRNWALYVITASGHDLAGSVKSAMSPEACGYTAKIVRWVQSVSFAQLLSAVYAKYPEYKANSVFVAQ